MNEVQDFINEMNERGKELEMTPHGPIDNEGKGEYAEFEIVKGVTLCLDWFYLDAKSTSLHIDNDYNGDVEDAQMEALDAMDSNGRFEWSETNNCWLM